MKIGFVRIFVTDFKKSFDFYSQTLGMEVDYTDHDHWAQFKSGVDISLAIEKCAPDHEEAGGRLVGRFVGVSLVVDDVNRVYRDLREKGVEFTGSPEQQPWGGTLAHFKDLDGNIITLFEEKKTSLK